VILVDVYSSFVEGACRPDGIVDLPRYAVIPGSEGLFGTVEAPCGGHGLLVVGYHDDATFQGGGWFEVLNSWGEESGEGGYLRLPYAYVELFGYEGGAFTGARDKGKAGLFELANHGTILLDEIGDMALPMQAKLLRVIQDAEIRRVGGSRAIPLDVRIISATSRNLEEMVSEGSFLDALYYRLNVVELQIPPLRQRREDILPLAEYYLQFFCEKYKLNRAFSPETRECFSQYEWPGNVRELRNTVENLVVSAMQEAITGDDLPARLLHREAAVPIDEAPLPTSANMKQAVEELQRQMVQSALRTHGSLRKAAAALDMDPSTLHRLAKKLNVEP